MSIGQFYTSALRRLSALTEDPVPTLSLTQEGATFSFRGGSRGQPEYCSGIGHSPEEALRAFVGALNQIDQAKAQERRQAFEQEEARKSAENAQELNFMLQAAQ